MTRQPIACRAARGRDDEGSITPLILGYAVILLLLVGVVSAASAVFLRQRALAAAADGAALAATRALDATAVRHTTLLPSDAIPLDGTAADGAAQTYLEVTRASQRFPGLELVEVSVDAGSNVHVTLRSSLDLPLVATLLPGSVEVTASAVAQGVVLPPP